MSHRRYKASLLNAEIAESDAPSPHLPVGLKKDYTLKEGQTFTIHLPGGKTKANTTTRGDSLLSTSGASGVPLLPPPPGSMKRG